MACLDWVVVGVWFVWVFFFFVVVLRLRRNEIPFQKNCYITAVYFGWDSEVLVFVPLHPHPALFLPPKAIFPNLNPGKSFIWMLPSSDFLGLHHCCVLDRAVDH